MSNKLEKYFDHPLFNLIIKLSSDLIIILDDELKVILFNNMAETVFHCTSSKILGQNFNLLYDQPNIKELLKKRPSSNGEFNIANDIHTTVNNYRLVWSLFQSNSQNSTFFLLKATLIGEKQHQDEIIRLETLLENMPCNVYWMDKNCTMLGANRNVLSMLNMTREEYVGKSYEELSAICHWPEGLAQKLKNDDLQVLRTGQPIFGIVDPPVPHSNKSYLHLLTSRVPIRNNAGEVIGVAGISVDITELKIAKEKAEAADRAKSAFIANMSHDVRGPVASNIGISELLETENDINQVHQYGHIIHETNESLLGLLNDILDMVAAEDTNEEHLKFETFNLKTNLEDLKKLLTGHAAIKHIDILINTDPSLPDYVISDKAKLFRILLNLINNAIKFTDNGSVKVDVELLEKEKDHVEVLFTVTDTGIGIPADKLDQIFERFFRVTPSYTNKYSGYGLGLFLVKKFVQLLKGSVNVFSELGKGTQFKVILPMQIGKEGDIKNESLLDTSIALRGLNSKSPDLLEETVSTEQRQDSKVSHHRALIVEDDAVARHIVRATFNKSGFEVDDVDSAEAGFNKLLANAYDLIVTDIGLPGLDGNQLAILIRAWERATRQAHSLPIIGLSAHGSAQKDQSLESGMDILFDKPITKEKMNTVMERFFSQGAGDSFDEETNKTAGKISCLGLDLPNTEAELFQLDQFELFDESNGVDTVGDIELLKEILTLLINETIPDETKLLEKAYANKDWKSIQSIAHKMKGGALYCGTIKMRYACQYMERYLLAGHTKLENELYHQLLYVLKATKEFVIVWLNKN